MKLMSLINKWKPIVTIIIFIIFAIFFYNAMQRSLGENAKSLVKAWISTRYLSKAMAQQSKPAEDMTSEELEKYGKRMMQLSNIEIVDITARGRGGDVVVKVVYLIDGKPPEDSGVKYLKMEYSNRSSDSASSGWRITKETTALAYYFNVI